MGRVEVYGKYPEASISRVSAQSCPGTDSSDRTLIILFLVEMLFDIDIGVHNDRPCNVTESLRKAPVPCNVELWAASTESDWVMKYKKYLNGRKSGKVIIT